MTGLLDCLPSLKRDSRWAWWLHHRTVDPEDFEHSCRAFVAERLPCSKCGAVQRLTATGIALDHNPTRHRFDRDWQPRVKPYRRAAPAARPSDPLEDY